MISFALTVARKDLLLTFTRGSGLVQGLLLGLLLLFVFSLSQGVGERMGWFGLAKNADIADRLCAVFAEWIDNGHNDLDSTDCIILKIRLTSGILYADGVRHEIDFSKHIYA